jgi:GntR family transcriptional regulator / MocR family aminotransferase
MTRPSQHPVFVLARGEAALHRQIYDHFRTAITAGQLRPGEPLPSARNLAQQLAAARGTADAAYAMLAGEGYIVRRGSLGTSVAPGLLSPALLKATARTGKVPAAKAETVRAISPFQLGLPALDAFPRKLELQQSSLS